jgi:hypothetical protein
VLPRRNFASSSRRSVLNPLSFMRLQPLCFRFSTPLLCFQWFAASFSKTPGVACTQQEPPSRISNLPARRPRTVCKPVTLASLGSICKPFPFILLRIAISTSPLFSQSSTLPPVSPPRSEIEAIECTFPNQEPSRRSSAFFASQRYLFPRILREVQTFQLSTVDCQPPWSFS